MRQRSAREERREWNPCAPAPSPAPPRPPALEENSQRADAAALNYSPLVNPAGRYRRGARFRSSELGFLGGTTGSRLLSPTRVRITAQLPSHGKLLPPWPGGDDQEQDHCARS